MRLYCNATYITDFLNPRWYEKLTQQYLDIEKSITNFDLWEKLFSLMEVHQLNYVHIKHGEEMFILKSVSD